MNNNVEHDPASFHVGLKILLINDKNEFLLLKTVSESKAWHNTWDLPGGRINIDEINIPFHQTVDREIKEEAGDIEYELRPDPVSLAKSKDKEDNEARLMILFEAKYISGEIKLCEEHSAYEWKKITPQSVDENFHFVLKQLIKNYFKWNK